MGSVIKMRNIFLRASLVLALLAAFWATPRPVMAEVLNLEQCLERALSQSLAVKKAEADISVADFQLKEAKAGFFPTFKTTYSYTRLDEDPSVTFSGMTFQTGTADNFNWEVSLSQPLFTGFRILTGKKLAELGLENANLTVELAKLDLALQVKQAYFNVLLAQKRTLVADRAIKQLEAQVEVAKNFYEVGMSSKNDLLQVEVELANTVQNKVNAENNVSLAKAQLNTILRRNIETPLELEDVKGFTAQEPELGPSLKIALDERVEMKQAQLGVDSALKGVDLAKADYYPQVALVGSYARSGDTAIVDGSDVDDAPTDLTLTLALNWTIWDWNARSHRVGASKGEVLKARHVLNQIRDGVALEIKQALLNLASTKKNIAVNSKAIEQAEESLRMSKERYREQVTTSTEVLDAQTRLSQAQVNYYAALYGYHLAQAQLKRAMGRM